MGMCGQGQSQKNFGIKFPKALPLITGQPWMPRGNSFTKFLCSTNTRKNLHLLFCFCLFFMKPYSEGKPFRSSWPGQVQENGILGDVHCPISQKCHEKGTGPVHLTVPHTQKIQSCAQLPAIKLQIKRNTTVDVLCLLPSLPLVA